MTEFHLLHVFPTFAVGGSQMRFARLVEAHGARFRHSVIALDGVTDMLGRLGQASNVHIEPFRYLKRAGLRNLPLFRETIRAQRPQLLVTYNWGAIEWALANRLRPSPATSISKTVSVLKRPAGNSPAGSGPVGSRCPGGTRK